MPAAAKLMADNNLPAGSVLGTGKDGRVTKGDVLGAVAGGAKPASIPTGVPTASLPQVSGPAAPDLGSRPEQRVPMTRLRVRVAERLLQSQATNAILTTFNEVNMKPVMDLRAKYKEKFEKEHDSRAFLHRFRNLRYVGSCSQSMREKMPRLCGGTVREVASSTGAWW